MRPNYRTVHCALRFFKTTSYEMSSHVFWETQLKYLLSAAGESTFSMQGVKTAIILLEYAVYAISLNCVAILHILLSYTGIAWQSCIPLSYYIGIAWNFMHSAFILYWINILGQYCEHHYV